MLEGTVDKRAKLAGQVLAVKHFHGVTRHTKERPREPVIVFLVEEFIPTDKTHTVSSAGIATRPDGRRYASMPFNSERLRVVS